MRVFPQAPPRGERIDRLPTLLTQLLATLSAVTVIRREVWHFVASRAGEFHEVIE
jgi:hypothetical protein